MTAAARVPSAGLAAPSRRVRALTALKRAVGPLLANTLTGRLAGWLFRDRIPHRGLIIDTSPKMVTPGIKAALLLRGYESGEYRFVRDYLPRDRDVIELGGSLGVISCTIRRKLDPARKLVVVEANPNLADALERNLALNGCATNVSVERTAIAYGGAAHIDFELGETSVSGRIAEKSSGATISVPAMPLSVLVGRHGLDEFSLVCDIEGVEWEILREDKAALARAATIIIEAHDRAGFGGYEAFFSELAATGLFTLAGQHGAVAVFSRA